MIGKPTCATSRVAFLMGRRMDECVPLQSPVRSPSHAGSGSSGFYEISLSPTESARDNSIVSADVVVPPPKPPPPPGDHQPATKKPSLKKKDSSSNVYDGVIHMGYIWHYNQNPEKKLQEESSWKSREERYGRMLRLDPRCGRNNWKRYYAVIWDDGRFAWYKPNKVSLYNKRAGAELEEVLFIPWRVCAFGPDVMQKLCSQQLDPERSQLDGTERTSTSEPSSPRLVNVTSQGTLAAFFETATKGLCVCSSPSVISLVVPPSPSTVKEGDPASEELTCIVPRRTRESLLFAVGGHEWGRGDVYCFATEEQEDLDLWKEAFALLSHRKTIQKSAFDHLLNTPVVIALPGGPSRSY
ncbi:uncharacterized protein LOC129597084 [Paramacrobiotus metropolitanus]|uniref:uncharacterized protein LOC129597084 n=1 Tax=Paramacrobiotus metropolitanus TaxID=2943436 RepID=UPI00244645BC|nr:uncharacterized protein LOC129597084 [Paramacrobiotus metropolitanus]XP_055350495.1 uncharacterized protein LOC129597084 [Paramacrobiotus metropolitanus]XP_055350496.1 uncharacterized protein LOC129597084 [Paramacrobiotus metropolitanus]